jgi:hypothetical protein
MIANVAYTLVFNTGLFPDACCAWQLRAIAAKIWAQFKIEFATSHREFCLMNQTAQQSGFHSANMMIEQGRDDSMQETAEAIAQLATATASDQGTVAAPCSHHTTQERDCDTQEQNKTCMAGTATSKDNKQRQLLLVSWIPSS